MGCTFQKSLLPPDVPPLLDDAGREIRRWNFDTAAEFGAAGAETLDMTIDPLGSITPEGYIYGQLVARGVQGVKLWNAGDSDWAKTTTVNPVGHGLWRGNDLFVGLRDLAFVGITDTAMVSLWFEGELWVNPNETFKIIGNDTAFLYVALDGKTFTKVAQNGAAVIPATSAGWYPVRIGWADGDNSGDLVMEVNPSGGGFDNLDHSRFRATTSHLRGTMRHVFYRQVHGGGVAGRGPIVSIQETPLHAVTSFVPPLPGSFTTSSTLFDWSARWTGQFYAMAAGSYTLRVTSDDGNRIQLGAMSASNGYTRDASGQVTTNLAADLVAGWNDLIIDYNHVNTTPSFAVTIADAPGIDATLKDAPIPRERLRPIEPRGDRLIARSSVADQPLTIVDNAATTFTPMSVLVGAHPSAIVSSLSLTARVTTPNPSQLVFRVINPANQNATVAMVLAPDPSGNGSHIATGIYTPPAGMAVNGTWQVAIADNSSNGSGGDSQYHELHVTARTRVGLEQIAKTSAWRSPIVENQTAVTLIDFVSWSERVATGTVTLRMRTCAMADCSDGVWSDVVNGSAPMLPPNRYIQLEVRMTSDGTRDPEVDKINVQYRTAPTM